MKPLPKKMQDDRIEFMILLENIVRNPQIYKERFEELFAIEQLHRRLIAENERLMELLKTVWHAEAVRNNQDDWAQSFINKVEEALKETEES